MAEREITQALIDAFVRLARGDFSVRLERNFKRDTEDVLAFFVNLIGEELARLLAEREKSHRQLEAGVIQLSESFLALAAGEFGARAPRSHRGDPLDVLAYLFNNTAEEVERAFAELEQQRRALETTLESMVDGVILLDDRGHVRRANAAMARLLGHPRAALTGRAIVDFVSERDRAFIGQLATLSRAAEFRDRGVLFRTKAGDILALSVNASFERGPDGSLQGVVLVARDDRELRAAQAQLQMTDRLATMGTLAAGVAHEINNPLAFVMANLDYVSEELEAARGKPLEPETQAEVMRALSASLSGAERVRQIVGDLKTFSRGDQETISAVDLKKLADSAAGMLRNEIRHHARLHKQFGEAPLAVGNEARLLQVFLNLLQNAAQAIPPGNVEANTISIVTGTSDEGLPFVEIHDTGSGIAEQDRSRLFDPFFTTKPVGVGTGLGLSISHKIVTTFGGRIDVSSEVGRGSCFRVVLPEAAESRRSSRPPPVPASLVVRRRVLVIDDEVEVGLSVERVLGRAHEVVRTTRGTAGLELLRSAEFDLILCDLMMPDMTGMELFAVLSGENPDIARRIVFMTGGAFSTGAQQFLESVSNRRIEKPFSAQLLRELVQEA